MNRIISVLLLAFAIAAPAAAREDAPAIFTKIKPKVGAWAEYSYESKKGDKTKSKGRFKMSVVGKEGDALWIEQKFTLEIPKPKKGEAGGIMKFLMGKDGVQKAFMKTDEGVMDMSSMMASHKKPQPSETAKMTEVGEEKIEVPAGKFKTTHFTFEEKKDAGDAWIKPGVGPYGMVKQVHKDGKLVSTLELLASGDDAKSEVDEKSAQSMMGAMMGGPERARSKKKKDRDEASEGSDEKSEASEEAAEKPSLGGFLKNALKKKAGLSGD